MNTQVEILNSWLNIEPQVQQRDPKERYNHQHFKTMMQKLQRVQRKEKIKCFEFILQNRKCSWQSPKSSKTIQDKAKGVQTVDC